MTLPANGTLKAVIASGGILIALAAAIFGYGMLHGSVAANTDDIAKHDERIDEIEDDSNDTRGRLIRIETQLERIIRLMEGRDTRR